MKRPRISNFKHQVFRSTAMQLAKEFLVDDPKALPEKGIDAERIRYEPITKRHSTNAIYGAQKPNFIHGRKYLSGRIATGKRLTFLCGMTKSYVGFAFPRQNQAPCPSRLSSWRASLTPLTL